MYERGKEIIAEGAKLCDQAKADTIDLVGDDKKEASVRGRHFEVGYYTRAGTPQFDEELFKDLYPKLYAKCLVTKTVFDEEQLKKLVKAKKIPEMAFNAAVVRPRGSRVTDIKRYVQ
jgi:transcription antitermination factor NusA-like protein